MRYRGMEITDYERVMALWHETEGVGLRDSDSVGGISRYLARNPGLSFVAEDDTGIVGTIMAGHDGKRGYIQHLAVAVSRRRQGTGSELLRLCLDALQRQGIQKSHVHVYADNESGRRFWARQDWIHRAELVTYSYILGDNPNV